MYTPIVYKCTYIYIYMYMCIEDLIYDTLNNAPQQKYT